MTAGTPGTQTLRCRQAMVALYHERAATDPKAVVTADDAVQWIAADDADAPQRRHMALANEIAAVFHPACGWCSQGLNQWRLV